MARTALLSSEELNFLRKKIAERFHYSNAYAQELKPNAFLPNYEELKQSMDAALPDMATSISLKRLRKLFYDTNVKRRGIKKAIRPGFGVDFLDACYLYITDKKHNRQSYLLNNKNQESTPSINSLLRKRLIIPGLGLLFIIIIVAVIWLFYLQKPVPYYQDFNFASSEHMIETLNNEGWNILDVDSNFLYKQDKPGHLALYTLAGDYWIKPNENPVIKNLFVKKLDCRNCTIELSIKDFNPSKPWEQVGIFFLDANLSRSEFFRITYAFALDPDIPAHIFQGVYGKEGTFDEIIRKPVTDKDYPKGHLNENNIWMKIQFDEMGNFEITGHRSFEWDGYRLIGKIKLDFKPKYVGLAAFHGFTFNTNEPLNGDTIPVYINYIKITPQ